MNGSWIEFLRRSLTPKNRLNTKIHFQRPSHQCNTSKNSKTGDGKEIMVDHLTVEELTKTESVLLRTRVW